MAGPPEQVDPSRLIVLQQLGEGGMAKVFHAVLHATAGPGVEALEDTPPQQRSVAFKRFNWDTTTLGVLEQRSFDREVGALRRVDHPNIVRMLGISSEGTDLAIVLELCRGGNLFSLLHGRTALRTVHLTWQQKHQLCLDIALAMRHLHSLDPLILHRDLKSPNILLLAPVNGPGDIPIAKLCDFGLSRCKADQIDHHDLGANREQDLQAPTRGMTTNTGSLPWMAPERFLTGEYDESVDVYSFGIVLYEIMSQMDPYGGLDGVRLTLHVLTGGRPDMNHLPADTQQEVMDLITVSWAFNPRKRPSFHIISLVLQALA